MFLKLYVLFSVALHFGAAFNLRCSPIYIGKPNLLGATILDVQASEVHNHTTFSIGPGTNDGGQYTISFCNVTVVHTHPGWDDKVSTQVWLPLHNWNGKFQALGGGGYSTGMGHIYLAYAVQRGFASASTDGGLVGQTPAAVTDLTWALSSKHNVNWFLLENYASEATKDMAEIGKQIIRSYYGKPAEYHYFNGCSGGGRQGLMMAQNFPEAFDGILAIAPAINIETFIPAGFWPTQVMKQDGIYPSPCEIKAFVKAAIEACDSLDGIEDSIISLPDACNVTAYDFVGQSYMCNGTQYILTTSGAKVVQSAWSGSGKDGYYGLNKDAELTSYYIPTLCTTNGTCHTSGSELFRNWISFLIAKDPDFAIDKMTEKEFFGILRRSKAEYQSLFASNSPDLSAFKANGGKMITWHGLADEVIPPFGTIKYYEEVLKHDESAHEFYRFFEAPGVGHCFGGVGPVPNGALTQLVDWVEKGVAPDTLHATRGKNNASKDLCMYPLKEKFIGESPGNLSSFVCTRNT
ncbi:Tannase/feruloyl esterase [Aspergillus pseudocaelatus]|uniref:Carboxylic ester hydrolase n=1 Tax=Aspergillus pseudocaelatus TaxID=1825620 RepID=A0ABQ6W1C4_9EURO|nr:Tannase/feruloyl esterase [Aspergillus pseudocaelatus]